jgi:uncharacterized protein (TIGR03000 family)
VPDYGYGYQGAAPYTGTPDDSDDYNAEMYGQGSGTVPPATDVPAPSPAATTTAAAARIDVRVPDSAELWVQGTKTQQTSSLRHFVSPPLTPGRDFMYDIRARWTQNGEPVDQTRHVRVRAGNKVVVNFLEPAQGE